MRGVLWGRLQMARRSNVNERTGEDRAGKHVYTRLSRKLTRGTRSKTNE